MPKPRDPERRPVRATPAPLKLPEEQPVPPYSDEAAGYLTWQLMLAVRSFARRAEKFRDDVKFENSHVPVSLVTQLQTAWRDSAPLWAVTADARAAVASWQGSAGGQDDHRLAELILVVDQLTNWQQKFDRAVSETLQIPIEGGRARVSAFARDPRFGVAAKISRRRVRQAFRDLAHRLQGLVSRFGPVARAVADCCALLTQPPAPPPNGKPRRSNGYYR